MLDKDTIVKAWRDPEFKASLSEEDRTALPESPAGIGGLSDEELDQAAGGTIVTPTPVPGTVTVTDKGKGKDIIDDINPF